MYIGDIIRNKYILIKYIGGGRFSEVWLGLNYTTCKYYAIKITWDTETDSQQNEINILEKITEKKKLCNDIPCISIIEHFNVDGKMYIVQTLMAGSLYTIMKNQYPNGFPYAFINQIVIQLTKALAFLHDELKIVHADIKPENILLVGHSLEVDNIIKKINISHITLPYKNVKKKDRNYKKNMEYVATHIRRIITDKILDNISPNEDDITDDSVNTDSDIVSSHTSTYSRNIFDIDDNIVVNKYDNIQVVDTKYILSPQIVLADFGNCIRIDDLHNSGDIQTRHYRSPEIILRLPLNEKIDIWAVGCTIYELITGKVLFDPRKTINITTDLQHICDIQSLLGIFPRTFYYTRKRNVFFRNNFFLKKNVITKINLLDLLKKNINKDITEENIICMYHLIKCCLIYKNDMRPSALQLLQTMMAYTVHSTQFQS